MTHSAQPAKFPFNSGLSHFIMRLHEFLPHPSAWNKPKTRRTLRMFSSSLVPFIIFFLFFVRYKVLDTPFHATIGFETSMSYFFRSNYLFKQRTSLTIVLIRTNRRSTPFFFPFSSFRGSWPTLVSMVALFSLLS